MLAFLVQDSLQLESRTWRRLPFSQYSMMMRNWGLGPAGSDTVRTTWVECSKKKNHLALNSCDSGRSPSWTLMPNIRRMLGDSNRLMVSTSSWNIAWTLLRREISVVWVIIISYQLSSLLVLLLMLLSLASATLWSVISSSDYQNIETSFSNFLKTVFSFFFLTQVVMKSLYKSTILTLTEMHSAKWHTEVNKGT